VKNIVLLLKKLLLFEIPYSIFDIQNEKHAKAIRLKGEGFKPGEWKNKPGVRAVEKPTSLIFLIYRDLVTTSWE